MLSWDGETVADTPTAELQTRTSPEERGTLTIADRVVERIASIAASEVPGVADIGSGWTQIVRRSLPTSQARVAGGRSRIGVDIAAVWPAALDELAAAVHSHVTERVFALTGVAVDGVDVTVADVVHTESMRRRVE